MGEQHRLDPVSAGTAAAPLGLAPGGAGPAVLPDLRRAWRPHRRLPPGSRRVCDG
ncbi:hypothetical protein [Paractinoplanes ferrugineus]|uniref:hypothetical protein n=1 Tax=Paractinoplanes ferrugineus TaxID=113564 RepID=UPI0031CEA893